MRVLEGLLQQQGGDAASAVGIPDDHGLDEGRGPAVVGQVRHEQHAGGADGLGAGLRQVDGEVSRGQDAFPCALLTVRGPAR